MASKLGQVSLSLLTFALASGPLAARHAGLPPTRSIDNQDRVTLVNNVHHAVLNLPAVGHASRSLPMERMILALKMDADAQARLQQLLKDQQDPNSPSYHKWLTAQQFGEQFGPSAERVEQVKSWLESQGFAIDAVSPSRLSINFSGDVQKVEAAFRTAIMDYQVDGELRHANATNPSLPRALADVVHGVVSMHNIPRQAMNHGMRKLSDEEVSQVLGRSARGGIQPQYTSGSTHYVGPGDFAAIYNVSSLYTASPTNITGAGQTIAIVGRTNIPSTDPTGFRSTFGLPANAPVVVLNGADPGVVSTDEEGEADLDVQWSGAVGRMATVKFVVSASTSSTDGVDLSAQYIADNGGVGGSLASTTGVASMSTSFGSCEASMGSTELAFYNNVWSQAAAEGISAFVSAGDAGAAGCNVGGDTAGSGQAVNGLASTPYNVCVGGTEFNDPTASAGTYWNSSNASGLTSAKGYIPEMAWNESSGTTDPAGTAGSGLWSTGGGVSNTYTKPSWQVASGVPADGMRDCPDVSFTAASHDGYLVRISGSYYVIGGTSASSPAWAGLMALVAQKAGGPQGNPNYCLYKLGKAQYAGTGATIFHDVTTGNNSVPSTAGFATGVGYDQATGLGSVDAAALANNWVDAIPPSGTFDVLQNAVSVNNQTVSGTVTLSATASDSSGIARVTFYVDGAFYKSVTSSPYTATLDTTKIANGSHTLLAYMVDNSGNISYTNPEHTYITTNNVDTVGPTGSTTITGTSGTITFSTSVTDFTGVGRVTYYVDGAFYKSVYASPYQATIDSTKLSNGTHYVLTYAVDTLGNTSYLDHGKPFTVNN